MTAFYDCGHCGYRFLACEDSPCSDEMVCPRCNWGTFNRVNSEYEKAIGMPYVLFTTGQVTRLGREAMQLRHSDLFKQDYVTKDIERGADYIPVFK